MNGGLEQTVDQMDVKRCAETIRKYADVIVGSRLHTTGRTIPGTRHIHRGRR